jgi:hypothetical protein
MTQEEIRHERKKAIVVTMVLFAMTGLVAGGVAIYRATGFHTWSPDHTDPKTSLCQEQRALYNRFYAEGNYKKADEYSNYIVGNECP